MLDSETRRALFSDSAPESKRKTRNFQKIEASAGFFPTPSFSAWASLALLLPISDS